MFVYLLSELRRHGVGHQWWWRMLRSLCLWEGERGMTGSVLCHTLTGGERRGLEVVLASKGSRLAIKVGLSVTVVAASAEAIGAAVAPIASVLRICAKGFIWSVLKTSTIIPVPKTAKITPSRGKPIPAVISEITTSAAP